MRVGFIGAGRMGRPMVARLVDAGHQVRTLGRSPENRRALQALGAEVVSDVAEAGAHTDVGCSAYSPTNRCGRFAWTAH